MDKIKRILVELKSTLKMLLPGTTHYEYIGNNIMRKGSDCILWTYEQLD